MSQREMTQALQQDGFQVTSAEVMKLRVANNLHMRGPNKDRSKSEPNDEPQLLANLESSALMSADTALSLPHEGGDETASPSTMGRSSSTSADEFLDADFTEPGSKKKRNRFKRDASGAVIRFPSEMTLDDARSKLGLDQEAYRLLRASFKKVCTTMDVSKKFAEPEKWEAAKTRLRHELPMLYDKLCMPKDELEIKQVALDAICKDVAKTMRLMDSKMTQVEVKNALGINPKQARDIRAIFTTVLREAGFANKPDATPTPQQWDDLRKKWCMRSDVIRKILDDIDAHPSDPLKKARALDVLSRDILKRLRDNRPGRHSKKQQRLDRATSDTRQPQAGASEVRSDGINSLPHANGLGMPRDDIHSLLDSPPSADPIDLRHCLPTNTLDNVPEASYTPQTMLSPDSGAITPYLPFEISLDARDVTLQPRPQNPPNTPQRIFSPTVASNVHLHTAVGQSLLLGTNAHTSFLDEPYITQPYDLTPPSAQMFHDVPSTSSALVVYFRMHPSSTFMADAPLWIDMINSKSIQELRRAVADKFTGVTCLRIEGVVNDDNGGELALVINDDHQLAAYLTYAVPPTFNVQLVHDWK